MNRFRSKKRNPESAGSTRRSSLESDVPPLPTLPSKTKTFRRNKKIEPSPPKPEVDISTALPASDDFRTSLLMPNLSARFSMLREQDDPTSMLGKANDDSVLFPKRASRLDLFNRAGLSDIAEVDSARGSMPQPFNFRTESYSTDGHPTDDDPSRNGSIMSRAKPGESNTMFGGRQKIFKIPVDSSGSMKSISGREGSPDKAARGMGGKALYESDIAMSAFQQLREQEKEANERAGNDRPSTRSSKEDERSSSPQAGHYNRNRETSSSTNSGPSYPRTSTAATSVASQKSVYAGPLNANVSSGSVASPPPGTHVPPNAERPGPKAKRLYGHGLDQHMYEQQSSAMHRLESLHRQRAAVPPFSKNLPQSHSATSLNNRYQRNGNLYTSHNFRTASPPPTDAPSRLADFDLGLDDESPISGNEKIDSGYGRSPPLSPPRSPTEDQTFMSALEPNDIGKATASGAFNKPRKQYDEQQYLQRQKQLQQGRETPPPIRPFSPNAPSIDEQVIGRTRNDSQASNQSKAGSTMRPQGHYDHLVQDSRPSVVPEIQRLQTRSASGSSQAGNTTSFLNGFSGSEVSSQSGNDTDLESPLAAPNHQDSSRAIDGPSNRSFPAPEQPARQQPERLPTTISEETTSDTLSQKTVTHSHKSSLSRSKAWKTDADSPTLGPANGLSGLVRAHLRNDSGQSSVYPEQSPSLHSRFPSEDYRNRRESSQNQTQTFFSGDALTDDEKDGKPYHFSRPSYPEEMPPPLAVTARNFVEQATALKKQESAKAKQVLGNDKAQRILGREAPRSSHESPNVPSWQDQLRAHHHVRGGSTETEKEREAFANELAERRRMVQDNLKTFVESESRSSSPGPMLRNQEDNATRPGHPFGVIRPKNSRGSLVIKNENPAKAMKMLGIAPGTQGANSANTSNRPSVDDFLPEESEQRLRWMNDGQRAQMPSRQQPKPPSQRSSPPISKSTRSERSGSRSSPQRLPGFRKGESTPSTGKEQTQSQNSQHFSRPGGPPGLGEEYMPVMINQIPPVERSQSALSGRNRSNSRTSAPGYFEQRATKTSPPGTSASTGHLPRPSPMAPGHSANPTVASQEASPSFTVVPSPQMITTPSSVHSYSRRPTYRKGSVNKHDISEPYFLSCTSSVSTVDLPPGASLSNGMDPPHQGPPPLPPLNPRRKRTQTLLQALGRLEKTEARPGTAPVSEDPYEERSTFSADEGDPKPKSWHKLRKSSSEGGNLNTKAKQQAMKAPSPAMPHFPQNMSPTANPSTRQPPRDMFPASSPLKHHNTHEESGTSSPARRQYPKDIRIAPSPAMHHFPPSDVPASAVMF